MCRPNHDPNGFTFAPRTDEGGRTRMTFEIVCCSCGAKASNPANASAATEMQARFFRGKGWAVGRRRRDDLCPGCADHRQRRHG